MDRSFVNPLHSFTGWPIWLCALAFILDILKYLKDFKVQMQEPLNFFSMFAKIMSNIYVHSLEKSGEVR